MTLFSAINTVWIYVQLSHRRIDRGVPAGCANQNQANRTVEVKPINPEYSLLNLAVLNAAVAGEILNLRQMVVQAQPLAFGRLNEELETASAAYLEVPFLLGCTNGSDTIRLALLATDIDPPAAI